MLQSLADASPLNDKKCKDKDSTFVLYSLHLDTIYLWNVTRCFQSTNFGENMKMTGLPNARYDMTK